MTTETPSVSLTQIAIWDLDVTKVEVTTANCVIL